MALPSTSWSKKELTTFILFYAASIDMVITEEEEAVIRSHCTGENYDRLKEIFNQCSDHEVLELILSYKDQYLSTPEDKEAMLEEMKKLFTADQQYATVERNTLSLFKRLL